MEVAPSGPQAVPEPLRRGTVLPLSQLVEESRSRANVPNHLLESKLYAKLKSNSVVQAEPPELHFSGFELGKDCLKILKLINISSEVMNIHIIPTQTKHFQTTYTKKCRLIPGLAYTLKVRFCPSEWRYFYDCVKVHCKGEENLLIPVHAYPVIDDLHIPPRIDLSAVPLGQSVSHAIPLRCSCPIDFEFQVHVIQPHEAFSICPLSGVIPANGEVKLIVTFSPVRYETSEVTIQLVISQFNTKPYLCTITGSCGPRFAIRSQQGRRSSHGDAGLPEYRRPSPPKQLPPQSKTKYRSTKDAGKLKFLSGQSGLMLTVDVSTPAGVAKMLIKDPSKLSSKALKEAVSCGSMVGLQTKQMKQTLFLKKVQENEKEEQASHFRWRNHLGKDPVSAQTRRQILEERQHLRHEYMVKMGDVKPEKNFPGGPPQLSSGRVLCEAGQAPEGEPAFHSSSPPQFREHVLRPFQQAARKIVVQCRANRRLACLKKLPYIMRNLSSAEKAEEKTCCLKITPDKILPFSFPVFSNEDDPLALGNLVSLPTAPIDVTVTTRIPFFKLQVPQHYKLMGYEPVTTWESFNSYVPTTLARPLRTGPADDDWAQASSTAQAEPAKDHGAENEEEALRELEDVSLSFTAPEALLRPPPANPIRIFNPAPGLQTYKPTPKYMECDLEFHLCPVPRYTASESNTCGRRTRTLHTQKNLLDQKEVIKGFMTWRNYNVVTLVSLSDQIALTSDSAMRRSVDYSTDILPLTAPSPVVVLPDDVTPLMDKECEGSGIQLTPEMIRAEFLLRDVAMSNSNHTTRNQREPQVKVAHGRELNQMGKRVIARLNQLGVTDSASYSPRADRQ